MEYKIIMIIKDENENEVFSMSTTAGMADFEENIIRKGERAIKDYESMLEVKEQEAIDLAKENEEYGV